MEEMMVVTCNQVLNIWKRRKKKNYGSRQRYKTWLFCFVSQDAIECVIGPALHIVLQFQNLPDQRHGWGSLRQIWSHIFQLQSRPHPLHFTHLHLKTSEIHLRQVVRREHSWDPTSYLCVLGSHAGLSCYGSSSTWNGASSWSCQFSTAVSKSDLHQQINLSINSHLVNRKAWVRPKSRPI